jgi:membrane protease subunit (stomatin/prohibitin family)
MGIWDRLKHELIDIVQWLDDTKDTVVYRFERFNNEIKHGAKLVVREGQVAVFVNEGKLADVFVPGTYTLDTRNLPILATLQGWKYGFESPFKAEVYFVNTRQFTNLKWGTMNPVIVRDAEFGPVRVRAFGTYTMRVKDAGTFVREIVGTEGRYTTEQLVTHLRNMVVARFSDLLGENKIPLLDLAGNYDELGGVLHGRLAEDFAKIGVEVLNLMVENVSLPPEVEGALDKRSSMGVIGDLNRYTQFQTAEAMKAAAENPSGTAGAGMGMGMGFAMAQQMGQAMAQGAGAGGGAAPVSPPPLPGAARFYIAVNNQQAGPFDATRLGELVGSGQLTRETLVWREGMGAWTPAGQVADLRALFGATPPPPIPPSGGGPPPLPR